jgi:hypothetical protein
MDETSMWGRVGWLSQRAIGAVIRLDVARYLSALTAYGELPRPAPPSNSIPEAVRRVMWAVQRDSSACECGCDIREVPGL